MPASSSTEEVPVDPRRAPSSLHEVITETGGATKVELRVTITSIGPKAKMAAFGMKWGYKAQLDKLEQLLAR